LAAIIICSRCQPVRRSLDEPDRPRSSSIISICASVHPYDRAIFARLRWKSVLPVIANLLFGTLPYIDNGRAPQMISGN
jgi:hypothetical protein